MKKVVIITGAGFAIPWGGPTTEEITNILRRESRLKTLCGMPLGEFLYGRLYQYYGNPRSRPNFETLMDTVMLLYDYYIAALSAAARRRAGERIVEPGLMTILPDVDREIMSLGAVYPINSNGSMEISGANHTFHGLDELDHKQQYLREVFSVFWELIVERIWNYASADSIVQSGNETRNQRLRELVDSFTGAKIRYYTTNYDGLMREASGLDFFDGFVAGDKERLPVDRGTIVADSEVRCHYNLHGSIFLNSQYNATGKLGEWFITRNSPQSTWDVDILDRHDQAGRTLFLCNIITGYTKAFQVLFPPFLDFYSRLYQDCVEADVVITIGCSFSDTHINQAIASGLAEKKCAFVNVQYMKDLHKKYNDFSTNRDLSDWNQWVSHVPRGAEYCLMVDDLDDSGWIFQKRQALFWKGTEDFLTSTNQERMHQWLAGLMSS